MGDWFQTIVDTDATEAEAPDLADSIHKWLVDERIVSAERSDCVLGGDYGYPPGRNYQKATDAPNEHLLRTATNGLEVIAKRTVFDSGQGGFELICSACSGRFQPPDEWGASVGDWYHNTGPGLLPCPGCGQARPIAEWRHDPNWGFGNLGFQFWNWPPLADSFVKEVVARLGHRVVLVFGKL